MTGSASPSPIPFVTRRRKRRFMMLFTEFGEVVQYLLDLDDDVPSSFS